MGQSMFEQIEQAVNELATGMEAIATSEDLSAIESVITLFGVMLGQADEDFTALPMATQTVVKKAVLESKFNDLSPELKRQVLQLLLVKMMKQDGLPANYQITPDAIGIWVAFFAQTFLAPQKKHHLLDLTVGSGNLLATVQLALAQRGDSVSVTGIDNDDTMLTLASGVGALLDLHWHLYNQDAVAFHESIALQDLVVADLPVGFYPLTASETSQVAATEGLTYVYHLLIEKAVTMLRPGGLGLLLVPASIFESEQAAILLKYLQSQDVLFQGLVQFPEKLFANQQAAKALLIIQRNGAQAKQAEPAMLAKAPAVTDKTENEHFVSEMTKWMVTNRLTKN